MQKKTYSLIAALCCVCFCLPFTHAQQTFWGITHEEYPSFVFQMNSNDLSRTKVYNSDDTNNPLGSSPLSIFHEKNGPIYVVNYEGGELGNDLGYPSGTVVKITSEGIEKILQLSEYAEGNLVLTDNQNGYLYGIGCWIGCFSSKLWKISTDGTEVQSKQIKKYGLYPQSLTHTTDGEIIGLSKGAGISGRGMLFKILPDLSDISIVYSFSGPDGKTPRSNLFQGQDGFLYGTTSSGGVRNLGVIFKIRPDGTEYTILHDYTGGTDGRSGAYLFQDSNGYIYGSTPKGGAFKKGSIFRMKPDGSAYTIIFDFDGVTISGASDQFIIDSDEYLNFLIGPSTNSYSYYKIKTDGTGLVKAFELPTSASIQLITNGLDPANTFIDTDENNVPIAGSFSVKKINNALQYKVELSESTDFSVLSFSGVSEDTTVAYSGLEYSKKYYARVKTNAWPEYGLTTSFKTATPPHTSQPRFWGFTTRGGTYPCFDSGPGFGPGGTIFSVDLNGGDFIKYYDRQCSGDFETEGFMNRTPIVGEDNFMYGLVSNYTTGTVAEVIRFDQQGNVTTIYDRLALIDGEIMQASNGMLYITEPHAYEGPNVSKLHKRNPDGSDEYYYYEHFFKFINRRGFENFGAPIELEDGYLYGLTANGGNFGRGVLYKISLDGNSFSVLHHFDLPTGKNPKGSLLNGNDGFLYGMTSSGGAKNYGAIFKIKNDGTNYSLLHSFDSRNGRFPEGNLIMVNNVLFGMTYEGGKFKSGVIFSINNDGTNYSVMHEFDRAISGANPKGSLLHYEGSLYGMTFTGGANNLGTVFKINTDGSGFTKKLDFSNETGGAPNGNLILVNPIPEHSMVSNNSARTTSNAVIKEQPIREKTVRAYPNPSTNAFTIELTDPNIEQSRFVITDIQGRLVLEKSLFYGNPEQVGESFPAGFYILKITLPGKSEIVRLIKK